MRRTSQSRKTFQFRLVVQSCALLVLLGACAGRNNTSSVVRLTYAPSQESPLKDLRPLKIGVQIVDRRPERERLGVFSLLGTNVAESASSAVQSFYSVVPQPDVTQAVYEAFRAEFENAGHRVVHAQSAEAEAVITVMLHRFYCDVKSIPFHPYVYMGTLNADLLVSRRSRNDAPAKLSVVSTARKKFGVAALKHYGDVSNAALAEFMHDALIDPRFLRALEAPP